MIAWLGMAALVLSAPPARRAPERCTTLLECELSCPEISVQAQRKSPQGQDVTFCDPVGEEVTWHNERTRAAQGERFGEQRTGRWRYWYPSGVLESDRHYADTGAPHGKQQFWHPNRRKKKTAHYDEGILDGSYTTWHANGTRSEQRTYKAGSLIDAVRQWHANGRLAALGTIKGQTIHWERYFSTGKLGLRGQVEAKGDRLDLGEAVRPTGEWTLYTARGRTVVEMRFQDGLIDGDYKRSFTNGQPMLNETYDRGQPVGTHTAYYRNGKLRKKTRYTRQRNQATTARFKAYYPTGTIQRSGTLKDQREAGVWRRFDRQGFLLEQTDYRKEPAQREVYDSFGTLRAQGALKKGLKQGVWRVFDATELKREEGAYKDGRRDGLWRFWNADGKPLAKGEFDQGRRVGPWRYDHPEGGKWFIVKPIEVSDEADGRYLHRGRRIAACDKLADGGRCHGVSVFDPKGRLRVRVTLPADWQAAAEADCRKKRSQTNALCRQDHGDLLHAIASLDKLLSRRRLQRRADCWTAGGEPERCPPLDRSFLPSSRITTNAEPSQATLKLPFSTCSSAESCSQECRSWVEQNDPFATTTQAAKQGKELLCEPSGPFVLFHNPRTRQPAIVGARALAHRQAPRAEFHGPWSRFHANGALAEQGTYEKGRKLGVWRRFHENGMKAREATYKEDLEMGLATTWHASGKMLARGRFAQGVRVGTWSFFDDAGQPTSKGDFKSGQRHGRWLLFDENGKPSSKGRYAKGRMVGRWTYFDPSGRKRGTCTWTPQDQDDRQVCRRNNGIKIREGLVREGLEEGVWRYFHRNGKKKAEGALRAGQRQGVWRFWHPSGKKKAKGSYSQGEKSGRWRCWDDDGRAVKCKKAS